MGTSYFQTCDGLRAQAEGLVGPRAEHDAEVTVMLISSIGLSAMDRTPEEIVEAAFGVKLNMTKVEPSKVKKWSRTRPPKQPPRVWDSRPRDQM